MEEQIQTEINRAFADLYNLVQAERGGKIPKRMKVAKRIVEGNHKNNGVVMRLGFRQLIHLATDFAPYNLSVDLKITVK